MATARQTREAREQAAAAATPAGYFRTPIADPEIAGRTPWLNDELRAQIKAQAKQDQYGWSIPDALQQRIAPLVPESKGALADPMAKFVLGIGGGLLSAGIFGGGALAGGGVSSELGAAAGGAATSVSAPAATGALFPEFGLGTATVGSELALAPGVLEAGAGAGAGLMPTGQVASSLAASGGGGLSSAIDILKQAGRIPVGTLAQIFGAGGTGQAAGNPAATVGAVPTNPLAASNAQAAAARDAAARMAVAERAGAGRRSTVSTGTVRAALESRQARFKNRTLG